MRNMVPVLKDENGQKAVPTEWRNTLFQIIESFKKGDFRLEGGVAGVRTISADKAVKMAGNIKNYGAKLTSLPEETWQTSACQWMRGYWEVLIDLFTDEEGASDLALALRVYEEGSSYVFEITSIRVP